ncbi:MULTISPECIES: universal stress protein [unclassified Rickettsia]|uniref:universal stress protein n=1 Tax=unclassified Rickettsia TaxID=114295 RepID=UPI00209F0D81|nr:universal stress protein [Rickettsia endosymbiont of Ceutorhynchus assimilis]
MYKNIIIPIDLADKKSIKAILPKALTFVTTFQAKLHFIYVISDFGMKMVEDYLPKNWVKEQKEKHREQVKELIKQYVPDEIEADYYIGRGAVYDEIIQYSNKVEADLIIISAVRPQLRDYMLGPNASKIVRHSSISVLVVRDENI